MEQLSREKFAKIDEKIKHINKLNRDKATIATFPERVMTMLEGMQLIQEAFNDLLVFKEFNRKFDVQSTIQYDYDVSDYAEKFYLQLERILGFCKEKINSKIIGYTYMQTASELWAYRNKLMQISARWHIERFINVYEDNKDEKDKAFPKRKPLLRECIFFKDRQNATKLGIDFKDGIKPLTIIFAVQPNSGKSFVLNVSSIISLCLHQLYRNSSGILRMSNNMSNAVGFSNQVKSMIEDEKLCLIYPEYSQYFKDGKPRILEKTTAEEWKMVDLDPKIRASFFARGRESAINSIRIFVSLDIDDLSDGFEQINNDDAHKDMTRKFEIDMDSRKESEDVPTSIFGTMFNEFDVPNTMIRKLEEQHLLIQSENPAFPNVRHTPDYSTVVIAVDCFNENGESIAPQLISTEKLLEKKDALKPFEFDLVYRQIRASREPRVFDYGNLKTYRELPKDLSPYATAVLDPTRKNGNDYFSLPVFRQRDFDGLYYFTNCIYEQKSLGRTNDPKNLFLDKVVKFIIDNQIVNFTIENNTSNTIGTVIEGKLKEKGYNSCKINEIYTQKIKGGKSSKMQRILDQEATIINNVVFPEPKVFPPLHPVSVFMEHFTRWDSKQQSNQKNHDDAPDSMAIFSQYHLFNKNNRYAKVTGFSKASLWR